MAPWNEPNADCLTGAELTIDIRGGRPGEGAIFGVTSRTGG
ncbi:MAG: hypothetical protein VX643_03225 [Chloroflexota bacterium]|nr:hypothetical protein [Chloroflexota bacterium]